MKESPTWDIQEDFFQTSILQNVTVLTGFLQTYLLEQNPA